MKNIIYVSVAVLFLFSCKKLVLDGLAFPSEKLDVYEFENYDFSINGIGLPDSMFADPSNYTEVTMTSFDAANETSYEIHGVFIGDMNTITSDTIILYLHGQSLHMDAYFDRASLLANLGGKYNYSVFMIDYRGYGRSEGSSTEQGLYEDGNAAIDWLISQGADQNKTFCYGFSLGAIPTIDRAAYRDDFKFRKIILESPLASVENLVHNSTLLGMSPGFVTTLEFPNAEKIKDVTAPLLWIHGVEDDYISIDNGELIYANHPGTEKAALRVPVANHADIPQIMGFESYLEEVLSFMRD